MFNSVLIMPLHYDEDIKDYVLSICQQILMDPHHKVTMIYLVFIFN